MSSYRNSHTAENPKILSHLWKIVRYSTKQEKGRMAKPHLLEANFKAKETLKRVHSSAMAEPLESSQMLVSVLGHATVLLRYPQLNILIDPVWSHRVGPFGRIGPKRLQSIEPMASIPKPDLILISHDHYDHLDLKALAWFVREHNPTILTGLGVGKIICAAIPSARVIELNWWEKHSIQGQTFTFVPAQHFSGRSLRMNRTLWGGFVAEINNQVLYYLGDSGYSSELFAEVQARFPTIDVGLIPIGAYEPYAHLKPYHLSPVDAVNVFETFNMKQAFAVHFGTYQLSVESPKRQVVDFLDARKALQHREHDFVLPIFGAAYLLEKMS